MGSRSCRGSVSHWDFPRERHSPPPPRLLVILLLAVVEFSGFKFHDKSFYVVFCAPSRRKGGGALDDNPRPRLLLAENRPHLSMVPTADAVLVGHFPRSLKDGIGDGTRR